MLFEPAARTIRVNAGAGAAVTRDDGSETRLEIELDDPACDITMGPCATITTATRSDLTGDWTVRPLLNVTTWMSVVGFSLAAYVELDDVKESLLRVSVELTL